ncbi:hypothetical protein [Cohnella zeiphila]|uniref:Uncharacterized protein n=1 Tax=Cohnella zeiphila TaxID=2761120 RepID=A0A7X0SNV6_9BACL|nr:hypothetical protein [Cohnella zeiphila]MBB6733445.1 hypothetical protein [Cohnella zeiphila]
MNKVAAQWKASFLQLRIYLICIVGLIAASYISQFIVTLSIGPGDSGGMPVSTSNILTVFLIFVATVLPAAYFKRIISFGATRKEYFIGLLAIYAVWSAFFSLLNAIWYFAETRWLKTTGDLYFNIIEIFGWDRFGFLGILLYQFVVYMLLLSLLSLLFSGLRSWIGWALWAALAAAIPVGTSIPSLRVHLADGFLALLFNDSLLQGLGWNVLFACLFLAGGWWLTKRRTF